MEILRRKYSSSYGFSFPSTPVKERDSEAEFEFGSLTPDSPLSDMSKNSPADHLFYNGRLLPHYFPCQTPNTLLMIGSSRPMPSRTSSVSSKDSYSSSLMSSRSNSGNSSRSSNCSSARTSYSSDSSERKLSFQNKLASTRTQSTRERRSKGCCNKDTVAQLYGSQRWQFMAPMPVLSRETSTRRKKSEEMIIKEESSKPKKEKSRAPHRRFCRKFFESFLSTCRRCHAMEAQVKDETTMAYEGT
ncbi:hypothetical protein CDL15_Pgr007458 [Punica granatum]|nr:hypothetical protein CDL15_Pgr007458 [Punica granatum]PKI56270.1 hypothetical protein CRG98_023289 [Punica granatum]